MKQNKKAFTLVELIVVIVILAILWVIAYISLQWYSKSARDSLRVSDIASIKTSLELFELDSWKYPLPTDWVQITYSWAEVWTQWIFGDTTLTIIDNKLDDLPTDPLVERKFTYSVLNLWQEYELWTILEWSLTALDNSLISESYADWTKDAKAYISWNYNGIMARVNNWNWVIVLAIPTIISWDIDDTDLMVLLNNSRLAYNGFSNLPHSYKWSIFKAVGESEALNLVNTWWLLLYSGSLDNLTHDLTTQVTLLQSVKDVYSGTKIIWKSKAIDTITSMTIDTVTPTDNDKFVSTSTVKYALNLDLVEILWSPDAIVSWGGWSTPIVITFDEVDGATFTCAACN